MKILEDTGGAKRSSSHLDKTKFLRWNLEKNMFIFFQDDIEGELSDVENFDKARPPPPRRRGHNISVFLRPAYEDNQVVRQNPLYTDQDETVL